ncbi:MAG: phage tail sheath C-terminal domain-containing protein, partial [Caulobacteraceae bacterium]
VLIERVITTYQLDPQGLESIAFLDITTLATLSALRFSARAWVARKFARMKLADDGQQAGRQRNVATPSRIKASLIGWAQREHHNGLIENVDTFAKQVRVQRDETDPNRVNCILPPDLVNQLLVTAMQVQFRL